MRIVDLFSGAGGLTFGFYYRLQNGEFIRTNNEFVFANEFDRCAANAFRNNFPEIEMLNCDIKSLSDERVKELIGDKPIDIIIGGPPCQSFSTVGKRRFDDKAKLYIEYLRMLRLIQPRMFLFENVKGMLSMREQVVRLDNEGNPVKNNDGKVITDPGRLILDVIRDQFQKIESSLGYTIVGDKILNAKNFGVPQNRERVFLVGIRNDLIGNLNWTYPNQTHGKDLKSYVTINEAISDLPALREGEGQVEYGMPPQNEYQRLMRGNNEELTEHFCGTHNDKLRKIIATVPQGEGRPYINHLVEIGELPQDCKLTSGYNNTYGRLVENQPSTTITNNMCTPSALRCIHYRQNRELSPREGARIQSFPDWFRFNGKRVNVTQQIGNAVPPLLALAVARKIEEVLGKNNE